MGLGGKHSVSALINCARQVSEMWKKNEINILKYVPIRCFFMIEKGNTFILITCLSPLPHLPLPSDMSYVTGQA